MYILVIYKIFVIIKKFKVMNNYVCVLILVIAYSYDLLWIRCKISKLYFNLFRVIVFMLLFIKEYRKRLNKFYKFDI